MGILEPSVCFPTSSSPHTPFHLQAAPVLFFFPVLFPFRGSHFFLLSVAGCLFAYKAGGSHLFSSSQACSFSNLHGTSSEDKALLRVYPGEGTWGILGMSKGFLPLFPVLLLVFTYFLKFKPEQCDLLNSSQAAGCLVGE